MQKLVEYSNYTSNSDPNYGIYISNSITYYGDFNTIDNAYYYNYDEFNKEKNIDVSSYVNDMLFNEFSTNEDFFGYMFNSYKFITDSLNTEHLNRTFDYYTVTYNFLRYNYLSKANKNKEYNNYIDFTYIIDSYNYEYDTSYSNYCNYLQLWDNCTKDTPITPFYIKILDNPNKGNITLKINTTSINNGVFECKIDNNQNFFPTEYTVISFNDVCYIKNLYFDYTSHNYDGQLFSIQNNNNLKYEIGGNILSLINENKLGITSYNEIGNSDKIILTYFRNMFLNDSYLYSADKLYIPLIEINSHMYDGMFSGCTNLTYGPTLLFQNINTYACDKMFSGCKNLSYLTLLTYNYAIYGIDNESKTYIINDIASYSHMFDNWLPENLSNKLNLTLNSNIKKHYSYNSSTYTYTYMYIDYITANNSNIIISYI